MQELAGNLFIISAPSGARKSSLIQALLQRHNDMQVSVSHTTRAPRPGEQDGVHYHFVSVDAFKDVEGHFLKRPEARVHFTSHDGDIIDAMIDESLATGERINKPVSVVVTCPSLHGDEAMATFTLTLSVKAKSKRK